MPTEQQQAATGTAPGNTAKLAPGTYGSHFTVNADGSILVAPGAYPDDVLAFVLGCSLTNPTLSHNIRARLGEVIDAYDERAVERHGYSHNPAEAAYKWQSVHQYFVEKQHE